AYSRFRTIVPAARPAATPAQITPCDTVAIRPVGTPVALLIRFVSQTTADTASTTSAASGRYMRRSAPTSVAIGTTLEAGASVTKNQAPRKPTAGRFHKAAMVSSS